MRKGGNGDGRKLGHHLNDLAHKPVAIKLSVAGEVFDLFIYPISENDLKNLHEAHTKPGGIKDALLKEIAVKTLKDADGAAVWDRAEDIILTPTCWAQLRVLLYRTHFGFELFSDNLKRDVTKGGYDA